MLAKRKSLKKIRKTLAYSRPKDCYNYFIDC